MVSYSMSGRKSQIDMYMRLQRTLSRRGHERSYTPGERKNVAHKIMMRCVHHWILPGAHGPTSWGICVMCGDVREFNNSRPSKLDWIDDNSSKFGHNDDIQQKAIFRQEVFAALTLEGWTSGEIGRFHGITRERVRQILRMRDKRIARA